MERQGADAMAVRLGAYDSSQHAQLDGFKSRGLRMAAPAQRHLYATEWRPLAASEATPVAVVVLSSACPFSSRAGQTQLSERLHADTLAALAIVVSTQHIAFERQALVKFEGALALVQRQSSTEPAPTVWLLTDSLGTAVQSAGLWGFARSVRMEASLPLQCTEAALTMAISYGSLDAEPDTVHQRESHLVPRLQTASPSIEGLARLHFHARGAISNLFIEQQAPVKRSEDELLLRVHAVGLNFRDVLNVLGEYPGDPGPPGGDSAGIVQEGALLNYFTPPAETAAAFGIGLAPLACLALAPATLLARKPVSLTFEQASTLPITWSTTHVALERAGLYAGHNIVVQAAAGGVGLKAIEYAQWLSAASLGTAGRPHKHAQLVEAGVKALGSSRSGDTFTYGAALLLCAARSRVVLNSLSLDFIAASFILLGEGAAFQEIGKRSIWASSRHAASSPATGYCAIALDLDIANDPLWWNRMLALLGSRSDAAAASSLPLRSFDMEKQHELGFRTLQSGLNTGKIVMRIATRVVAVGGGHAVTGGTSGIGLLTGRWLGQRGAHHLVLASRSGRFGRDAHSGMELPKTTKVEQCDTGDVSHVHRLMSACSSPSRPLLGIWHAAGVIADAVLSKQDALALVRTYAPKAYGAWSLQAASAAAGLHTFALFSSVAGLFGGAGQANYSAANVCLDALASHRRTRSAAAVSVQWGAWADVGMATRGAASERMAAMEAASGFARIEPAQGLRALATAVRPGAPWVMSFVPVTWSRTRSDGAATPAFLSAFAPKTREAVAVRDGGASSASCVLSLESVLEMVQRTAGGAVDADAPLMESGVDSLGAVELRNQLQTAAGSSLPSTLVFDHPTARQLGLLLEPKQAPPSTSPSTSPSRMGTAFRTGAGVCVDGASALISAGASSPLMASHMMACSSNTITEVPAARWFVGAQPALAEPMASRVRHGGFVLDAHLVDSAAFGIVPAEAAAMDPCQRLLLERGYEALHDANLGRLALGGSLTGVFLGFAGSEFGATLAASPAGGSVYAATGASVSIASGRISYALGLNGPCVTYDTACSAALSASHAALCALQLGACDTGLVVGVSLMFAPAIGTAFAVAGMTSAQGRSHTFDARADGYARGEACGGVALRDDGEGHSVSLLGAVVRQDGRSASLTAPNGQSQQDLIVATLADASTSIDSLGQNEAHGTGTILGDPIEAGSLTAAVLKFRAAPLAVGGVKANIGHAEPAAGMTGLLKLSFGLRRGEAAPNAQLRSLNPLLGLSHDGVPCVLPVQLVVPRATQSTGGVSSFGYSGTIVHAVLCSSTVAHTISTIMAPLAFHRHAFSWREQSRAAPSTPRSRIGSQSCATRVPSLHEVLEIAQLTAGTQVDADAPLMDAGLDSHGAVELRNLLHSAAGGAIALPDTLVFDFPTSRKLLNFFLDRSQPDLTALMPLMDAKAVTLAGRSASLPHGVASPGAAYCMSEGGVDTISEVPLQRWSTEGLPKVSEPIASRRRHGGFLEGAELFDNKCFLIPPREVAAMDPQQRCVLEHGYSALHEVGFDKSSLEGSVTGVFIGIQALEFPELLAKLPAGGGVYSATGSAHAIVCGRVSFVLGLQGACAAYDSACSSGLVATHAALSALTLNECASGLAIGINLMLLPALCLGCATAGMTSALGRCHTFDGRADGYARSEACSAHTLQQGSDGALQASLELCGGAVRQDGKSASLTAPNGQAQQALRLAVRARAGNFTHRSRFVEAHGTGTALGDPIEAGSHAAVASTLGEGVDALGSVKANLGHSEPGAGSSGLLMLTLQLGQSQATANAQLRVLNPRVRTALGECISVLHVQGEAAFDSASGSVSSFGYGGTIAHLAVVRSSAQTTVSTPAMRFFRRRGFRWREFPRRTRASAHSTSVTARSQPVAARSQSVAAEEENESRMLVQGFYDAATVDHNTPLESQFLTFGPFREIVPGFNWLHAFSAKPGTVVRQLLEASQICMRKLLYRHVDWERTQRVFDFGCGQGVDLCILARDHPHLVGDGFTLSPEQAAKARANAAAHGLDGRVNAYVNNSARDPLPSKYELVQGFEVAHHIPLDEKAALFRNCGNGMRDGGHIVMADFIVNGMGTIDNDNISSYFIGVAEWAKYLGEAGLAVTDVVDISVEVSNFLHVVDFGDEFGVDDFGNNTVNDTFSSYNGLGRALRAGLTSYVLIDAQKVRGGSVAERIKANEVALTNLVPFQTVEFAEYKRDWPRWLPVVAFATEWVPLPKPIGTTSSALLLSAPRLGLAGRVGGPSSGALPMGAGADGILLLTEGCTVDLSTVCSCLALLQGVALAASKPAITLLGLRAGKTQGHRQTGTVGLARGLRVEDPSLELFCVCAEPQLAGSVHKHAVQASCAVSVRDPDVLLGSSGVSIPRLKVRQLLDGPADKQAIDGSHVVTGGTSGLGLVLARWLGVSCDAKSVLLASRTGVLSVGAERAMSESGVETSTSRCNVAEATDLSATLIQALSKPAPHSLWHCAGMLEDAVLAHQAAQKLQNVYAPKAAGASGLHRLAAKLHVRTAVFYSSVVVVLGGPGQSNYAAVNESLDLLVAARRSSALAAHSPQWGAWGEVGMASRLSAKQLGAMGQLQPEEGMAALQGLMQRGSGSGSELILRFSFGVFMKSVPALLEKLIPSQSCGRSAAAVVGSQAKIGLPVVLQLLESIAVSAIDADAPLQEAGLDSLGSIDLRNQLQELVGDSRPALPSTLIFEHPTARQVALLLSPSVADSEVDSGLQPPDIPLPRPSLSSFPFRTEGAAVQVIGCSSCAPAGASSPAALAATVSRAVNAVSEVPATRWTITDLSDPSAIRANHGGFMKDLELFDGVRFAVLAAESAVMDPQQRQLLERGYEMLHASGFDRVSLIDSEIAVSIGIVHTEMARVLMHSRSVFATTSSALSIAAGRLPYVLGLHGPCAALETACSAAVVATHFAMRALQYGECEVALAAGVNSMLIPATSLGAASAGMTSARGRSHTFDSRADGYVRSEACGGFTLEYSDSEDELAILGSAVRQDGRTASLTAPNGKAQRGLLVAALSDSHMSAMDLGLHETHGTGTALGDPIETGSLVAAVLSSRDLPLAVVGVKANLGHAEPAAGMTGLLKMALGLQRGDAAPNAQLRVLNPHVGNALQSVECALPVQLVSSMADVYRQGGVSSFGYSGTIANEVMQFVSAEELLSPISAPLTYRRRVYPWCEACAATEVKRVGIYAAVWAAAPVTAASSSSLLLMGASCSCCFTHAQVLTAHPWGFVTVLLAGSKSTAPSLSGIHLALSSVQQLLGLSRPPRLLVLTGGALAANDKHDAHNSAHGGAWGFGRVVNLEQPPLRAQIADVAACASVAATAALAANGAETELMWSGEMRHVARLRACSASSACHSTLSRGTYAITGGLGGLGLRAATLLVDGGASRVLIASRSGRVAHGGQGLEAQLESLAEAGWMIACDSASMCDTGALLRADLPAGVLHAAGAADKGLLNELAVQRVYWLSASKSLGAWYVHCAAVNGPLEVQILFSSVGSGLGNVGQANYAISNACLEARALSHQSNGMVACTLQWPIVGGAGMGAETFTALAQRQVAIVGLAGISLEEYAACLGAHLQACELALSVQIVHRSDIHALQQDLADATQPRFMELVMHAAATAAVASTSERTCKASGNAIAESLVPLAPSQRRVRVETAVLRVVRELTGAADAALTAETPLMDAGVDSLAATELSSRLRSLMGVALSPTIVFEQPSPRAVAVHLLEQMSVCAATTVEALPVTRIVDADAWMPLELSGMIGRWPGGCGEERARQELQVVCGDAVGRVPWTRWVLEEVVDVSTLSTAQDSCVRHGGFVAASQRFDARAFGISPAEVSAMDPQQRLLLELGYASLHGSSHRRVTLMGGDSGVLLGIERPDWALASPPAARSSIFAVTGDNVSAAAGRVSFVLGLQGPCSSVDTACSSALVAIHWGSHAVRGGGCADAMGLAVSLKLATFGTLGAAAAGMLSSDGRCKTLDASANGYVRSEGVGALVLRQRPGTLQLNGSAVRQDGRSASLTAPNGSAQRVLLHQALGIAMLTPQEVGFVEAHGTGTPLGDPTEAGALADVHGRSHLTRQLVVGAVKANVGHSESASGQVGMLKLRQLLNCLRVPGNAHLRVLNPLIGERMASGCFLLSMHDIVSNSCSAMSAFGFSGTIAHLALTANPAQATGEYISTALYNTTLFARHSFAWRSQLHPLAQFQSNLSDNAVTFRSPAAGALHALVANHVVGGRVVLPGAAYLEVARAAACSLPSARGAEARLRAVFFLEPLEVRGVHMECALVDGRFEVRSGTFVAPTLDAGSALNSSGEYDFRSSWKELDEPSVVRRCVVRARSNELSVEAAPSLPLPATIPRLPLTQTSHNRTLSPQLRMYARC